MCPICSNPKPSRNIYCSRSCRSADPVYREHLSAGRQATPIKPLDDRFWKQVNKTNTCWEWMAHLTPSGYGQINAGNSKMLAAHRYAYQTLVGVIPDGLVLDHLCRNRKCVRPEHLEPVTMKENIMRGVNFSATNAKKTHCPQGHEYNEANTRVEYRGTFGMRRCRACVRARAYVKYHAGVN